MATSSIARICGDASDAVYVLTCTVSDQDQARAETDWDNIWHKRITHVEDSLKLP